jgi:DNA-binding transcriptional regulator YdaS (Cro superfamily)
MNTRDIIKLFGGQTALAKLVGIQQSAVAYWAKSNSIPSKWHSQLLDLALSRGVALQATDLIQGSIDPFTIKDNQNTGNISTAPAIGNALAPSDELNTPVADASPASSTRFLFYAANDGTVKVQVLVGNETVWASQRGMAEIFGVDVTTINYHLKNIYQTGELDQASTIGNFPIVQNEGGRQVKRDNIEFYNLDTIISVGYRVNSLQATQFRKWATTVLRDFLIKGFALDDDRLKQGNQLFGKDYFDDLLERIREIRASERRFHQKITDIYSQCSIDYDKNSQVSFQFYAHVQDKLHYAIHGHTSAELIALRADASKPHMGLTTYKNAKTRGKITKLDVTVGKNYLDEKELEELNRLVSMYLDYAENFARRQIPMKMQDWSDKLNDFLSFNAYPVLESYGNTRRDTAEKRALSEYEKFRVVQDKEFKSDFDRIVDEVRTSKKLPKS